MRNKQPIDYVLNWVLEADWQTWLTSDYHKDFGEISRLSKKVEVGLTQAEWEKYQSMKWLSKELWLRTKILEQVQNEAKTDIEQVLNDNY